MIEASKLGKWGKYNGELPCLHLVALRRFLEATRLSIWSERGENPEGWVNVHCDQCDRTYEVTLAPPWRVGAED